ncbi:Flavonol 3-O-glucosyltransferase UGT89B1 [Bienertia sinuspersici]
MANPVSDTSQKLLTEHQMDALVEGLERNKARFIWVINSANSQQRVLDRFHDDWGVVLRGWAPLVEILNHKAVVSGV